MEKKSAIYGHFAVNYEEKSFNEKAQAKKDQLWKQLWNVEKTKSKNKKKPRMAHNNKNKTKQNKNSSMWRLTFWQYWHAKCPTLLRCDFWWRSRWWRLDKTASHSGQLNRRSCDVILMLWRLKMVSYHLGIGKQSLMFLIVYQARIG